MRGNADEQVLCTVCFEYRENGVPCANGCVETDEGGNGMSNELKEAREAYQAAFLKHAQLEERFDAIEQMPDRETELRWDNRLEASAQKVQEAVDRLHAAGGRTYDEARATRPSERFVVRSMGDMFGLGESWEVYDEEFDRQVTAVGSEQAANDYLVKADAKFEQKQREQQERAARRQEGSI